MSGTSRRAAAAPEAPRARRPRGSLTREAVIEAALAVIDAEGMEALSMPRLARELNAGVMSLYRYVQSKQELLDAVAMRAIAEVRPRGTDSGDGRGTLLGWGHGMREVLLAHPGVADVFAHRAVIGPGIFLGMEGLLGQLQAAGFPGAAALRAIYAVLIYTLGFTIWEVARVGDGSEAYAASWREGVARLTPGALPHVEAVVAELGTLASDAQYDFGLQALVRGFDASGGGSAATNA